MNYKSWQLKRMPHLHPFIVPSSRNFFITSMTASVRLDDVDLSSSSDRVRIRVPFSSLTLPTVVFCLIWNTSLLCLSLLNSGDINLSAISCLIFPTTSPSTSKFTIFNWGDITLHWRIRYSIFWTTASGDSAMAEDDRKDVIRNGTVKKWDEYLRCTRKFMFVIYIACELVGKSSSVICMIYLWIKMIQKLSCVNVWMLLNHRCHVIVIDCDEWFVICDLWFRIFPRRKVDMSDVSDVWRHMSLWRKFVPCELSWRPPRFLHWFVTMMRM